MIDIRILQKEPERVIESLSKRGVEQEALSNLRLISLDYKNEKQKLEKIQAEQNSKSKLFAIYKRENKNIDELKDELEVLKEQATRSQEIVREKEEELTSLLYALPNLIDEETPFGEDESANVEIKRVLEPRIFDFEPKEHWELAAQNGWIDFEAGVKIAKSRFSVLRGEAAKLERALINYMLDFNSARGFAEVCTPYLANRDTLFGTGQLPKFEDDLYKISHQTDDTLEEGKGVELYLIPTAEVTLTNLYRDEIIKEEELPIKLTSHTPCFRKEAGSARRDTRGIIREHQFHKVELVAITKQEDSQRIHQEMIDCASSLLESLALPHRLVQLCSGDIGFSASNTVDIEVWLPGQNCYREISSISNTRDFQARRAKIRYKEGKKNILAHTLNGSSLAVGRTIVAIMENYQREDGRIDIPEVLQKYIR